jgi:hypothetical protein
MKIFPPGTLTQGNNSEDALILEARYLLAFKYNNEMRCIEASRCFDGDYLYSANQILQQWDEENSSINNKNRLKYYNHILNGPVRLNNTQHAATVEFSRTLVEVGLGVVKTSGS